MRSDEFQFSGSVPEPIDQDVWGTTSSSLTTAIPYLNYYLEVIGTDSAQSETDKVIGTFDSYT